MIKFVDMFSGIGGFREGLTRAGGFTCVGHCEIDKYANRSYNARFDTKGEWFIEDARKADPSTMPDFQLLCGGFPCQTFSIAGSRKGFGDPRGTLFFELARLAEARKPPYLLFENVVYALLHIRYIFDLDGVLCHTDEYHYMAWKAMADELHIPFNREVNNQLRGVSRMESLELILRNSPVRYSEQEKFLLAEKKNNIYRELLQNITSKDLADGAWTVLDKLHAVHIPMAIGSSSKNTPLIVEKLGIGLFFDAIVDGNQISHSKPDPEVFLLAAEKLHQKPSDCLVVEDAEAGVKAALNGGFLVAGIGPAKDCPNINYPLLSLSELLAVEGHPA